MGEARPAEARAGHMRCGYVKPARRIVEGQLQRNLKTLNWHTNRETGQHDQARLMPSLADGPATASVRPGSDSCGAQASCWRPSSPTDLGDAVYPTLRSLVKGSTAAICMVPACSSTFSPLT